jgi:hypothetical protein
MIFRAGPVQRMRTACGRLAGYSPAPGSAVTFQQAARCASREPSHFRTLPRQDTPRVLESGVKCVRLGSKGGSDVAGRESFLDSPPRLCQFFFPKKKWRRLLTLWTPSVLKNGASIVALLGRINRIRVAA